MRRLLVSCAALSLIAAAGGPAFAAPGAAAPAVQATAEADARLAAFFETAFTERLALSPQQMTALGLKTGYDRLDDYTPAAQERSLALAERQLAAMRAGFDPATLSPSSRLSFRLFEHGVTEQRAAFRWRDTAYPVASSGGPGGALPVFLINNHRVDTVADAEAYVARLVEVERVLGESAATIRTRVAAGITPPTFVWEPALGAVRNVTAGAPFTDGPDVAVWADIQTKVNRLDLPQGEKDRLIAAARDALTGPFKRGYDQYLATLLEVQPLSTSTDGVWRLPDGEAYYNHRLQASTTTDLTADQIHAIGLAEVARIQAEMEVIQARVGFDGTLQDFFTHLKTDPRFQYPNTAEGKAQYLEDSRAFIAQVMAVAPDWFSDLPEAALEVRAVEPWREASSGIAFYNRPAADGSRPGIYYVNLSDMTQVLRPQIEGISYHEGAPGHHFQIAYAQEIEGLPRFRRFGGYGVYSEGWGLYAEKLGKEMGFYQDPYSDFGRLSTELWRAVRLVLDTGLHAKRWSRDEAVDYFRQNSLLSERDIRLEVNRYISGPGQATSYKVGELKILELRERARTALGDRFNIRDFHTVVLGSGAVPLDVLEEQVDVWIAAGGGRPPA
jgi:uncharacterized protein (DUF885 family)